MTNPSIAFWDFSLAHYGNPRVADACLQLQDSHDVNVNLLLWALWLESKNLLLSQARLETAINAVSAWEQGYVRPLRCLRREMKLGFPGVTEVREHIKKAELLAEKQEQQWLEELVSGWLPSAVQLEKNQNLALYLHHLNLPLGVIQRATSQCALPDKVDNPQISDS